jgi:hypothetical protein
MIIPPADVTEDEANAGFNNAIMEVRKSTIARKSGIPNE